MLLPVTFTPIGVLRTPFPDRLSAPRQPSVAADVEGRIELVPGRGLEHAIADLDGWERIWVLFWFHLNAGFGAEGAVRRPGAPSFNAWRPKVLPPRSAGRRRGVLATRSPHRPNPIGLSAVRLVAIEGLVIRVRGVDMVDGTPVLDIKPYVPYADAFPDARSGWIEPQDPEPGYAVAWSALAAEQAAWLEAEGVALRGPIERVLSLGPQPHPYRRIKPDGDAMRLAVKSWRVRFRADGRRIEVLSIGTGYRERELAVGPGRAPGGASPNGAETELAVHRAFVARFGRG